METFALILLLIVLMALFIAFQVTKYRKARKAGYGKKSMVLTFILNRFTRQIGLSIFDDLDSTSKKAEEESRNRQRRKNIAKGRKNLK